MSMNKNLENRLQQIRNRQRLLSGVNAGLFVSYKTDLQKLVNKDVPMLLEMLEHYQDNFDSNDCYCVPDPVPTRCEICKFNIKLEEIMEAHDEQKISGRMSEITPEEALKELQKLVDEQAEDQGIWIIPETATEDYLQKQLRELHHRIESFTKEREVE